MKLVLHLLLAIFLPPVAVFLLRGTGKELIVDIVLLIFLFFPSVLFALYIVLKDHKIL